MAQRLLIREAVINPQATTRTGTLPTGKPRDTQATEMLLGMGKPTGKVRPVNTGADTREEGMMLPEPPCAEPENNAVTL